MDKLICSKERLTETAKALRRMNEIYEEGDAKLFGIQFGDLANILEEAICEEEIPVPYKRFCHSFSGIGINVEAFHIKYDSEGRIFFTMLVASNRKRSVKVADITELLSTVLQREMKPVPGSRSVITRYPVEIVFADAPKYFTLFGQAGRSGMENSVSGDCFSFLEYIGGKAYLSLADGMGMGVKASNQSKKIIELFEQYLQAGFSAETSLKSINSAYSFMNRDESVAMDCVEVDLYSGTLKIIKQGGTTSFIKRKGNVTEIVPSSLPLGIIYEAKPDIKYIEDVDGSYIILVSDGVVDALPFADKEGRMCKILESISAANPSAFAAKILEEVLGFCEDERRDDMTVLVLGIWRYS
ncbi:MAG: SpoIIE family protein phosphatase [Butyrivibrio sp.]|nr:SpoIIE family protein phosphatase [Butyrivibrio sp.]